MLSGSLSRWVCTGPEGWGAAADPGAGPHLPGRAAHVALARGGRDAFLRGVYNIFRAARHPCFKSCNVPFVFKD